MRRWSSIIAVISLWGVLAPVSLFAQTPTSVVISAQVNAPSIPGGGGGGSMSSPTQVVFSGMAYPSSKVVITQDGSIVATTVADPQAKFSVALTDLLQRGYTFSVYGEDVDGRKSTPYSFPIFVTQGTTVTIGGIFISPTIDVDKLQVKKGDPISIFGRSIPNAEVSIVVNSPVQHIKRAPTDQSGAYFLRFDSAILEYGDHTTKSAAVAPDDISLFSDLVPFKVGDENILKVPGACEKLRGDVNCDGRVNLIDFSIMAFWYKKPSVPTKVDLNKDRAVTLVDFSIMAYNWTG